YSGSLEKIANKKGFLENRRRIDRLSLAVLYVLGAKTLLIRHIINTLGQLQLVFDKMKIEMQNQTAELKESITNGIMDSMDEKVIPIVEENKELKIRVDTLEKEIERLKRAEKSKNNVVFCIEEKTSLRSNYHEN
ncbi:hypothetical protein WA026_022486, partial [Henosepilachna vigintioctopunctata]